MPRRPARTDARSSFCFPPHFMWLRRFFFRNVFGLCGSEADDLAADAYAEAAATAGGLPTRALLRRVADCNVKDLIRRRRRRAVAGTATVLSDLLSHLGPDAGAVLGPEDPEPPYIRTLSDYSYVAAHGPEKLVAEKERREVPLPTALAPSLREVADLMAHGVTDIQDIAAQLEVSDATVRQRKSRLLRYVADQAKKANDLQGR